MLLRDDRKRFLRILLVNIMGILFSLPVALQAQAIRIGGTGAALGTMRILAEGFKKSHPDAKIIFVPGLGSGGGRRALLGGAIDIALSSKAGNDVEKLEGALAVSVGRSPLVFATGGRNTASGVTTENLVDIWNGKTTTWPDGSRLRLILRPESDSDTDVLRRISPAMEQAVNQSLSREGLKIAVTDDESAEAIESIQGALGTSVLALIITEKRPIKALAVNGVAPTPKTIANGSYPYFKSFYAITMNKASSSIEEFVAFLSSSAGREILTQSGFWVGNAAP